MTLVAESVGASVSFSYPIEAEPMPCARQYPVGLLLPFVHACDLRFVIWIIWPLVANVAFAETQYAAPERYDRVSIRLSSSVPNVSVKVFEPFSCAPHKNGVFLARLKSAFDDTANTTVMKEISADA